MSEVIIKFYLMVLLHIIADFNLQGVLAKMKQRGWWIREAKRIGLKSVWKYRNDYACALYIHSLMWAILVCAPLYDWAGIVYMIPFNAFVHCVIDDMKCNFMRINLIQDQALHAVQIGATISMYIAMR